MSLLIICKEELAESANHLARAVGNPGDEKTFTRKLSKKDGLFSFTQYFRVCNFGTVPERLAGWVLNPQIPAELPEGVEREKCEEALAAMGVGVFLIPHSGDALQKITDLGYKVVEES